MSNSIETFRISLFGSPGVGKSSLTTRLALGTFSDAYDPTQEDAYRKHATIDGKEYLIEFIDTLNDQQHTALRRTWISESDATLLVYSITSRGSFEALGEFHSLIKAVKTKEGMWDPFQICIVGNKSDLKDERAIITENGKHYAKRIGSAYEEVSAKSGENVEKTAYDLVRKIITYRDNERIRYEQIQEKALRDKEKKENRKSLWKRVFN